MHDDEFDIDAALVRRLPRRPAGPVLDFGCAGVGDPACDLMPAWTLFDAASRPVFRAAAGLDDDTWERGRAWAFAFGVPAWHCYRVCNPPFAEPSRRTVNRGLTPELSST